MFLIGIIIGYLLILFLKKIDKNHDKPLNIILRTITILSICFYLLNHI